jgi:alpha-L-fucosidase
MRGDGTIDEREIEFLEGMAKWMDINGEGIFNTRPWKVYGEGPTQVKAGMFNENAMKNFTSEDIRFTSKGNTLYAFIMDYPKGKEVIIKSLAKKSELLTGKKIASVKLLGVMKNVYWNQSDDGLKITLPEKSPVEFVAALKIKLK